jgi:hypothetical protein
VRSRRELDDTSITRPTHPRSVRLTLARRPRPYEANAMPETQGAPPKSLSEPRVRLSPSQHLEPRAAQGPSSLGRLFGRVSITAMSLAHPSPYAAVCMRLPVLIASWAVSALAAPPPFPDDFAWGAGGYLPCEHVPSECCVPMTRVLARQRRRPTRLRALIKRMGGGRRFGIPSLTSRVRLRCA